MKRERSREGEKEEKVREGGAEKVRERERSKGERDEEGKATLRLSVAHLAWSSRKSIVMRRNIGLRV